MYVSLYWILCCLSSLWMLSLIMTYDYDTLIFAPVPLKKILFGYTRSLWRHVGSGSLTKDWTQAPCNLLSYFCPWNLEPDIQLLCVCLCHHTSQESRPRMSWFNILFDCSSASSMFFFFILQSCFSLTFLWSVEGSKTEEPVRHPRVLIWHTKLNSTSCELYRFFSISPHAAYLFALNQCFLILTQMFQEFFWFSSLS